MLKITTISPDSIEAICMVLYSNTNNPLLLTSLAVQLSEATDQLNDVNETLETLLRVLFNLKDSIDYTDTELGFAISDAISVLKIDIEELKT